MAKHELLGMVSDPVSSLEIEVISPFSGIIIGRSEIPLVYEGEAVYHIARFEDSKEVAEYLGNFHVDISPDIGDDANDDELAIV
ncbi:hypothetical protein ABXJ76_11515 [Methylobacter sp. G7]|uniref:hypothetical protein n=1 Tax=Methylobacter sp. G7 TaxID=3230117 RepID=UPI003D808137